MPEATVNKHRDSPAFPNDVCSAPQIRFRPHVDSIANATRVEGLSYRKFGTRITTPLPAHSGANVFRRRKRRALAVIAVVQYQQLSYQ